jgi:hypothetical protein
MSRANRPTGAQTVTFTADTSGVDRLIAGLESLLIEKAPEVAAAGALVVYDEVKLNVSQIGKKSGNLHKSIYRVLSEKQSNRATGKITYHISWNYKKAPHGRLLEWGWQQRYKSYINRAGDWKTLVRPGVKGKKPGKNAKQAVKDAYYVPLDGGPIQRPGYAFVRRAQSAFPDAVKAMELKLVQALGNTV